MILGYRYFPNFPRKGIVYIYIFIFVCVQYINLYTYIQNIDIHEGNSFSGLSRLVKFLKFFRWKFREIPFGVGSQSFQFQVRSTLRGISIAYTKFLLFFGTCFLLY